MLMVFYRQSKALLGQNDDDILRRSWCIAVGHADGTKQDRHHFVSQSNDVKFAWENVICKTNWWKLAETSLTLGNLLDRGTLGQVFEGKLVGLKSVCIKQWREPRTSKPIINLLTQNVLEDTDGVLRHTPNLHQCALRKSVTYA